MCAGGEVNRPNFVGAHYRGIEPAVWANVKGVGHRDAVLDEPRSAAVPVKLHDPRIHSALAGDQAALMIGNWVGNGHVAGDHRHFAIRGTHRDATQCDFGDVEIACLVENQVVGRDDVATQRADYLDRAGVGVDRADTARRHRGNVYAAIGASADTVRAGKAAR